MKDAIYLLYGFHYQQIFERGVSPTYAMHVMVLMG